MPDYNEMAVSLHDEAKVARAGYGYRMISAEALDALAYTIEELSRPRWISVDERLPENRRDVQITVFWHDAWRTMYGYYDGAYWHLYAPMHTEVTDVEVIGWMEKPSPMSLPRPTWEVK